MDNEKTNIWLISIAIFGLILSTILSLFFSYIPLYSIKQEFFKTTADVEAATKKVIQIAEDVKISALKTVDTLDRLERFEQAVCTDVGYLLPSFCP